MCQVSTRPRGTMIRVSKGERTIRRRGFPTDRSRNNLSQELVQVTQVQDRRSFQSSTSPSSLTCVDKMSVG